MYTSSPGYVPPHVICSIPRPLATAVGCVLLATACAVFSGPLAAQPAAPPAGENRAPQPGERSFDVAAGPLSGVLSQFAGAAGVALSFDAGWLEGMRSSGLSGHYTVDQGFDAVLAGSGFVAVQQGEGKYRLQAAAADGVGQLPVVNVSAGVLGATTDGTGSYTTGSTNSAAKLDMTLRETPQSVTVFTRARIDDQSLNEIGEVLDQTVGVTANASGALGSDGINYYARGFEVKNYQVDGASRPTTVYGFEETTSDMAVYDRVEIVRGATGLLNGVGNPSATINLVRKRPTAEAAAYIAVQAGSYDRYRLEADVGGPLTASGNVRGRLVAAWQENDSHLDRMHIEKQVLYGVVDMDLLPGTLLTLGLEYQDFDNTAAPRGGLPLFYSDGTRTGFSRSTNVGAKWSDFANTSMSLFASLEHRFANDWRVKLEYEHSRPDYDESIGYLYISGGFDPLTGQGADMLSARWAGDLEQNVFGVHASGPFSLFGRTHELVLGGSHSVSTDKGHNYPGWWSGGDYSRPLDNAFEFLATGRAAKPELGRTSTKYGGRAEQSGAYAAVRLKPLEAVSVILGSRVSDWEERDWTRPEGGGKSYRTLSKESGVVTPYAGIVVEVHDNLSLYASYTEIFEPQGAEDIDGRTLDPLEGVNYEVGIKAEFNDGLINASAAVFRIEQDNFAVAIPDTFTPDGGQAYRSEQGTVSKGFEVEAAGELRPGWQLGGGFSRAEPEDSKGDRLLTYVPRDTFKLFSTYRLSDTLDNLTLGGNLRWQGRAYIDDAGPNDEDFSQGSIATVDLMARYAMTPALSVNVNVNNLLDKTYYSGLSYAGVYGSPRTVTVTAKYAF